MKSVAFVSRKGGSSKTTLAGHVAVAAVSAGMKDVVLVDADPQQSLSAWMEHRQDHLPRLAKVSVGNFARDFPKIGSDDTLAVVDTPGFDSGATASIIGAVDLVAIPVRPSPHDLLAVGATVKAAQRAGKPFVFVVSQAIAGAAITSQVRESLSKIGPVAKTVMHHRVAYAGSMSDGRTVQDLDEGSRASQEMVELTAELLLFMKSRSKKVTK